MKKLILSGLFVGLLSTTAFSYVDLFGIYVSTGPHSFRCAMISKSLCARVGVPTPEPDDNPWRTQMFCYNPDGTIAEQFEVESFTITEDAEGTTVNYIP